MTTINLEELKTELRGYALDGKVSASPRLACSAAADAIESLQRELEEARRDAERWKAFRSRDELPDLDYTHFRDQFREDADSIIDAVRQQKG